MDTARLATVHRFVRHREIFNIHGEIRLAMRSKVKHIDHHVIAFSATYLCWMLKYVFNMIIVVERKPCIVNISPRLSSLSLELLKNSYI